MPDDPKLEAGPADPTDRRPDAEELFERTVRRMLKTSPKPHKDMKLGKPRRSSPPEAPAKQRAGGEAAVGEDGSSSES